MTGRSSAVFRVVWTPPTRVGAAMDPGDGAFIGDRRISRRNVPRGRRAVSRNRTPSLHRVAWGAVRQPVGCGSLFLAGKFLMMKTAQNLCQNRCRSGHCVAPTHAPHRGVGPNARTTRWRHRRMTSKHAWRSYGTRTVSTHVPATAPGSESLPRRISKPNLGLAIPRPRHLTRPPTPTFSSTPLQCGWKPRRSS